LTLNIGNGAATASISWAPRKIRRFACGTAKRIRISPMPPHGSGAPRAGSHCLRTAALAGWARGSPLAEKWDIAASDALEDLIVAAVRREQQSARRRRPFSARSGYTPF